MAESLQNQTWIKNASAAEKEQTKEGVVKETRNASVATSVSSSVNTSVVQRVTASPRQVKTQIAKISYVPAGTAAAANKPRQTISPCRGKITPPPQQPQFPVQRLQTETPLTTPPLHSAETTSGTLKTFTIQAEEFHKKKDERDKEIQEIQNMLNEITNSPQKQASAAAVVIAAENETAPVTENIELTKAADTTFASSSSVFRRSKTETHIELRSKAATTRRELTRNAFGGGTSRIRSRSSQPPPCTKSNELLDEAGAANKKKSYNPEEARRFMEEQKRKRRSNPAAAAGLLQLQPSFQREKSALEREQIKQRLEELRRNTRQIVNKNLKKKQADHLAEQRSPRMDVMFRMTATQRRGVHKSDEPAVAAPKQKRSGVEEIVSAASFEDAHKLSLETQHGKTLITRETASRKLSVEMRQGLSHRPSPPPQVDKERGAVAIASKPLSKQSTTLRDEGASVETAQDPTKFQREHAQKSASTTRTQTSINSIKSAPTPQPPPLTENQHKRIGLLRKPELKDHSFSAIKEFSFDKENVALEMMTPNFTMPQEARIKDKQAAAPPPPPPQAASQPVEPISKAAKEINNLHLDMPAVHLKPRTASRDKATEITPSLGRETTKKPASTKTATESGAAPHGSSELSYWLKPSAVRIYPYNFIMAVRKKLDAIANPMPAAKSATTACSTKNQTTSTGDLKMRCHRSHETPLSSVPKERIAEAQQNVKRRIGLEDCCSGDSAATTTADDEDDGGHTDDSFATHIVKSHKSTSASTENLKNRNQSAPLTKKTGSGEHVYRSQTTLSDFHSNFSSMSLQMPASNTVSEVSSLRSESIPQAAQQQQHQHKIKSVAAKRATTEAQEEEDDKTSVSSSIFNSPEKKLHTQPKVDDFEFVVPRPVSPLSLARIEKLKIRSKSNPNQAVRSERGEQSGAAAQSSVMEAAKSDEEFAAVDEVGINFNQLLDDFNRSLSQVIQVNEQLKSTLDKSNQIFSPERKGHIASGDDDADDDDQYTTDFEKSSSAHKDLELSVKKRADDMQHSLRQRKRNLFELANAVKPLLTSPRSDDLDSGKDQATKEVQNSQLALNFKSLTNSSENSSYTTATSKTATAESSEQQSHGEVATNSAPYGKNLREIERLKVNLKQTIFDAKASRSGAELPAQNIGRSEVDTSPEGKRARASRKQKSPHHSSKSNSYERLEVSEALEKSQSTSNTPQKPAKHSHKSEAGTVKSASTKQSINTASPLGNRNSSTASNQSSASKSTVNSVQNTASKSSDAAQHHNDSASNCSPNAKTHLTQMQHSNSHSSSPSISTQKSSGGGNYESRSITEELKNAHESPSRENTNGNLKVSPHSTDKKHHQQQQHRHHQRSSSSSHHSKHEAFVRTHINRSRGDFLPDLDENAVSNESHFQAAIAATVAGTAAAVGVGCRSGNVDADNSSSTASVAPPSYHFVAPPSSNVKSTQKALNSSLQSHPPPAIGSEIAAIFNQSDLELSLMSSQNDGSLSESSLNYSNIGLYEKLIQTETTKSEHLTALLKMREKALLDRTKGQIAWLEVQKERYKAQGLLVQITAIKKKQRGILLKMEKEREEIKRLLQSTSTTSTQSSVRPQGFSGGVAPQTSPAKRRKASTTPTATVQPPTLLPLPPPLPPKSTRSTHNHTHHQPHRHSHASEVISAATTTTRSAPIIRADYKLESSRSLEELLQRRESDLRKRREHVERLMQWHQRLDQEEAEVLQLEHMLINYNNAPQQAPTTAPPPAPTVQATANASPKGKQQHSPRQLDAEKSSAAASPSKKQHRHHHQRTTHKMERRLNEIDKSLRELSSISASNTTINDESAVSLEPSAEFVRTTGSKLNKLWRRLTSQQVEKFEPNRRYKLCKTDLERLYEEAKIAVLRDFAHDEERIAAELLERSEVASNSSRSRLSMISDNAAPEKVNVPRLNLNFSSATSDADEGCHGDSLAPAASTAHSLPQGNYSPSAAEEDFQLLRSSAESNDSSCSISKSSSSSSATGKSSALVESKSESRTYAPPPLVGSARSPRTHKSLIERNVAQFLARSQQLLRTAPDGGGLLQRSLSDTQIVAPHMHAAPHANIATSQRNISVLRETRETHVDPVSSEKTNDKDHSSHSGDTLRSLQSLRSQSSVVSQCSSLSNTGATLSSPTPSCAANIPRGKTSSQQSDEDAAVSESVQHYLSVFTAGTLKTTENSNKNTSESLKSAEPISSNMAVEFANSKASSAVLQTQSINSVKAESREQSVIRSIGSAANSSVQSATVSSNLTEQFAKTITDSRCVETANGTQSSQKSSEDVTNSSVKSANLAAMTPATGSLLTLTEEFATSAASQSSRLQAREHTTNSSFVKSASGSSSLTEQHAKTNTDSQHVETAQQSTADSKNSFVQSANSPVVLTTASGSSVTLKVEFTSPIESVNTSKTLPTTATTAAESAAAVKTEDNTSSMQSANTYATSTPPTTVSTTSKSPQLSNSAVAAAASERQAREINAKLEEISVAVSQLSHANALPSYQSTNTALARETPAPPPPVIEVDNSHDVTPKEEVEELHSTTNANASDFSYSCHFENISTDLHSPSGCTLKGSSNSFDPAEEASIITCPSASATFITSAHLTLQSKTFTSDAPAASTPTPLSQSAAENRILDTYEADFECSSDGAAGDETRLDDLSMPQFETTIDTTQEEDDFEAENDAVVLSAPHAAEHIAVPEEAAEHIAVMGAVVSKELLPPPPQPPPAQANANAAAASANNSLLMPDIINELEIRRCQQILLENEHLKQYEHVTAVPYMYVREIPNKPPPPYVPPAHGSPMTTIFPSEERIKDITYRRTHELYCELSKTDYTNAKGEKIPTVAEEKITNIYERIILDICREYLDEHREVLTQGDPGNFHSQLAFFNPPDRLRCIQQSIYKEVRRCLAMDKSPPKRTQVYSVYGQRAKRDHIGKIIIQEMYDEDDQWRDFHREENEVLELIVEEMLAHEVRLLGREVLLAEGGTVANEDDGEGEEDDEQQAEEMISKTEEEDEDESNETVQELAESTCTTSQAEEAEEEEEVSLCIDVNSSSTH